MARSATPNPQPDDFVGKVVKDPANPPNAVLVQGYIGRSDDADHVRVYGDPSLSSYVDVPTDSVLHSERLPAEQSPLGGSVLWVDGSAPLRSPQPQPATAADFLRGPVQADLGPAAATSTGDDVQITLLTYQGCQNTAATICTQWCSSRLCGNTTATVCTQRCPPTHRWGCPSVGPGCGPGPELPAQRQIIGPTGTFGCSVPPNCLGPTGTQGCGVTHLFGCPSTSTCPPNQRLFGTWICTQLPGACGVPPYSLYCNERPPINTEMPGPCGVPPYTIYCHGGG
jgi:hypothetical protein